MSEEKNTDEFSFEEIKEEMNETLDEEEFTRAMESLSDTDRDIFEDTGVIHIDRDMPAETQAMHVVELQKEHNKKRNLIYMIVIGLMILGAGIALIGLGINKFSKNRHNTTVADVQEGVDLEADLIAIDANSFPDTIFRSYVQSNFDTNGDGALSPSERNAVLMIIAPEDTALTTLKGIEDFPLLQSLTFKNTGVSECDLSSNTELTFIDCSSTPIASLTLPLESRIETINTDNTGLTCSQDSSSYYNACAINTQ